MKNIDKNIEKYNWLTEIVRIIKVFIIPYKGISSIRNVPPEIKKQGRWFGILNLLLTIIALVFSFMLKGTNMLIEHKFAILGIIVFMLYKGEHLITQLIKNYMSVESESYNQTFDDMIIEFGAELLGRTENKVFKYSEKLNMSVVMENESLINCIKRYVQSFWNYQVKHIFDILDMCSVIIMLGIVFVTNEDIPNSLFIPFVVIFAVMAFILTAYKVRNRRDCWDKEREFRNEQSIIVNDMMRVKSIVQSDLPMRIKRFKEVSTKNRENKQNLNRKLNKAAIINSMFELFFQYGIIMFYVWQISWSNITLSSITLISANLAVLMTTLGRVGDLAKKFNDNAEEIAVLEREAMDLKQIMKVFEFEVERISADKPVKKIEMEPFFIQYERKSDSDKPFCLESPNNIMINQGEVVVFTGVSGSGKSTVMKLLMDKVRVGKSTDIPNTSRFLYFDETLGFGSLPIFYEFFSGKSIHLEKAYSILENLHLAQELKFNLDTMETWMKCNFYKSSMSHGQKQRIVLAKILYHLDDNIDMLLLDEVTSGLDENANEGMDANQIMEFCVRFANSDRKRIVLLSTHQSFQKCRNDLESEGYTFRIFNFGDGIMREVF